MEPTDRLLQAWHGKNVVIYGEGGPWRGPLLDFDENFLALEHGLMPGVQYLLNRQHVREIWPAESETK